MSVESNLKKEKKFVPARWPSKKTNEGQNLSERMEAVKRLIDLN